MLTGVLGAFERAATATSRSGPRDADAGPNDVLEQSSNGRNVVSRAVRREGPSEADV